jgi:hypothetical protein
MSNITMVVVDGVMNFSCGCKAQKIGGNFMITPCNTQCEVYQYALQESVRKGNSISIRDDRRDQR